MTQRPRHYELIVFDWDGTLYDSTRIIVRCIQAAVVEVGGARPSDERAAWVIGLSLGQALAHAAPDVPKDRYPALSAAYRAHYDRHQNDLALFDGVLPMLDALAKRGHKLAVATGKSRSGLDHALEATVLRHRFAASRTADETAGKPDPRMLNELMEQLQVEPARTLMIGDTTHDLQLARNAQCDSVAVTYGAHSDASFQPLAPRFIADSVQALERWLLERA